MLGIVLIILYRVFYFFSRIMLDFLNIASFLKCRKIKDKYFSFNAYLILIIFIGLIIIAMLFGLEKVGLFEEMWAIQMYSITVCAMMGFLLLLTVIVSPTIVVWFDEERIYSINLFKGYRTCTIQEVKDYEKKIHPFAVADRFYIYLGKYHLKINPTCYFGGRSFLDQLCKMVGWEYFDAVKSIEDTRNCREIFHYKRKLYRVMTRMERMERKQEIKGM